MKKILPFILLCAFTSSCTKKKKEQNDIDIPTLIWIVEDKNLSEGFGLGSNIIKFEKNFEKGTIKEITKAADAVKRRRLRSPAGSLEPIAKNKKTKLQEKTSLTQPKETPRKIEVDEPDVEGIKIKRKESVYYSKVHTEEGAIKVFESRLDDVTEDVINENNLFFFSNTHPWLQRKPVVLNGVTIPPRRLTLYDKILAPVYSERGHTLFEVLEANQSNVFKNMQKVSLDLDKIPIIGKGANGTLYDLKIENNSYALKVLDFPEKEAMDLYWENLGKEIETLEKAQFSSHVIGFNGIFMVEGKGIGILMEKADGSLAQAIEKGPASSKKVTSWLQQASELHDQLKKIGVEHNDIKPENIMTVDNNLKLIDFDLEGQSFGYTQNVGKDLTLSLAEVALGKRFVFPGNPSFNTYAARYLVSEYKLNPSLKNSPFDDVYSSLQAEERMAVCRLTKDSNGVKDNIFETDLVYPDFSKNFDEKIWANTFKNPEIQSNILRKLEASSKSKPLWTEGDWTEFMKKYGNINEPNFFKDIMKNKEEFRTFVEDLYRPIVISKVKSSLGDRYSPAKKGIFREALSEAFPKEEQRNLVRTMWSDAPFH